ncbi:response regulator transcription factor [Lysinibacillus pakistanensis]|uniref:Response regulator transcription factor n=1 Tax=Lysinibacillus pakistanensis TaxID=759811 RepID=A0AAX3X2A2_9BACI|nr:response regulator transcription factor [Lysinibacillus pakistanensis]MDM5233567.1 response regulator transcription factor [Lysinibacillus pakistanensis]WHY49034.1 response regulator transcription factor [Lysinibacillus pakistanensis]WHY54046.1 response regulator transcription factor [Lysinibacillus pakistanensis]
MNQILIIDDESSIRQLIRLHLENAHIKVIEAASGQDAIGQLQQKSFDMIILDLMMANGDGFEVLHYLKEEHLQPLVIVLSARREVEDKITVLGLGADDYVTKPFSPIELVARVQAQLRRHSIKYHSDRIRLNKLVLEMDKSMLHYDGQKQRLTTVECQLLQLLMRNVDRVLTKREIYQHIWQHEHYDDNNLSVFISRLRKILEQMTGHHSIRSIRGVGYQFSGDEF